MLSKIPRDKLLHFIVGVVAYGIAAALVPSVYALIFVVLLGAAKEGYDAMHPDKHTSEFGDALATSLGGLVAFAGWSTWLGHFSLP